MITSGLMSSASAEHYTPPRVLDLVTRVAPIGLDPCWSPKSLVRPLRAFTPADDGLQCLWVTRPGSLIFVNSPYGRGIGAWQRLCAGAGAAGQGVVSLVPARTDAAWFQRAAGSADLVFFFAGRLRFWTDRWCQTCEAQRACTRAGHVVVEAPVAESDPAPFPSCLLMWGRHLADKFVDVFNDEKGWLT